ncbi:Vacuolar protein sorting-associated protein 45 [Entamoeba marina]
MNVISFLQQYIDFAFNETPCMKALIMDSDTIPIVSILHTMTEIIQTEVFLVQQLNDSKGDTLPHFDATILLIKNPSIRYQQNSELSKRIAEGLTQSLDRERKAFGSQTGTTLFILVRIFDPITPLLTQRTYQAMIHEFLGITNGKVTINVTHTILSNDAFYNETMYLLFSDVTDQIIKNVNALTQHAGVKKHLSITNEINKTVSQRKLLDVSKLEQEIVCGSGKQELYNQVIQLSGGPYSDNDKLRVSLLYSLKYEEKANDVIEELIIKGVQREEAKKSVAGVENVFIQHKLVLENLLDALTYRQLLDKFPYCKGGNTTGHEFIIYIVGGVTLEEQLAVATKNRTNQTQHFIINGSNLLNTTKYLEQLNTMKK